MKKESSSLLDYLNQLARANRLNAIEEAQAGRGRGETNFNTRWEGYSLNNRPTVSYNGRKYNTNVIAGKSAPLGAPVYLRVGWNIKFTDWK